MALLSLFDHEKARREEALLASAGDTAQLSVAVVENDFNERVYEKLSLVYDLAFGPALQPGRRRAVDRMALVPGARILEVGVGTGANICLYPADCRVVGIDLSVPMLEKAHDRVAHRGAQHVSLLRMDAADLKFFDNTFDIVYAPYLISVVPDPVRVVQEMCRVCRPGGRILILNHFLSPHPVVSRVERLISPLTVHVGFKADLDLGGLVAQAGLTLASIEKVNFPKIWSLVTCVKEA
jgi:phosphatidylethanolamine/phosphatidyl-N-methylethanolamine N-methyltransferase